MKRVTVETSPSLALIKYWGKSDIAQNLPATSSLAVTLDSLRTTTTVELSESDEVYINNSKAPIERFRPFFDNIRNATSSHSCFTAHSSVNFPIAAGLASSSSGLAALALGTTQLIDPAIPIETISSFARFGSASAARSVFGGFTVLKKDSLSSVPLHIEWSELRVIVAIVSSQTKPVPTRNAMELARTTSPFYKKWLEKSEEYFTEGLEAVKEKNLKKLGPLMRQSYLAMFSTMLTSTPPILYWMPESVALLQTCENLRNEGIEIWETMDAGPQVKMVCLESDLPSIQSYLHATHPEVEFLIAKPGGAPRL